MTSKSQIMTGLITGAAVGAAAGLLLVPKPGKVNRRFLAMRGGRFRHNARRYVGTLREKVRRSRGGEGSSLD